MPLAECPGFALEWIRHSLSALRILPSSCQSASGQYKADMPAVLHRSGHWVPDQGRPAGRKALAFSEAKYQDNRWALAIAREIPDLIHLR